MEGVICCFCGDTIGSAEKNLLVSWATSEEPDSGHQGVYCHPICLKRSLIPNMNFIPCLTEWQEVVTINMLVNRNNSITTCAVHAIALGNNRYLVDGNYYRFYKRDKEHSDIWQFHPGDIVECFEFPLIEGGSKLLAFRKVESGIFDPDKWKEWEKSET